VSPARVLKILSLVDGGRIHPRADAAVHDLAADDGE
jgi:hypothetical protein